MPPSRTGAVVGRRAVASVAMANEPARASFLGVERSAKGLRWRERLTREAENTAMAIAQRHDLPELIARMLAARGVGLEEAQGFLTPTIKALMPDPSVLRDMDRAARRLADAIEKRQRVAIFGDYDVDGACSSALLQLFFAHHGVATRVYIPDRLFEGYGPNPAAIETLVKEGADLIVTVDCGTMSHEPLALAQRRGRDVIVLDHHQADALLPEVTALVNPNRQDDLSGLGYLCAAGVVFMTLVATARELRRRGAYSASPEPRLLEHLDLVALATVADVVPLKGLNRAYVLQGLAVMRQRRNTGLKALLDAAGLDQPPTPYVLGFVLGPRINAGGRIGDAALGARLLATDDELEAARISALLDKLNKERKAIETEMLEAALAEADRLVDEDPDLAIIVAGSEHWHKGIVGLVASRVTERYRRPSCIISWESGSGEDVTGTGSLRSVAGVDVGRAVRAAVAAGHLVKGGGHAMAAGLTLTRGKLGALTAFLASTLAASSRAARAEDGLDVDGALLPSAVNDGLIDLIERAGPYGQGHPAPRFVFPAHRVKFAKTVGERHIRCVLEAGDGSRIDAVAFRAAGQPLGELLMTTGGMAIHVAGQLKRDSWGGREKIELTIDDAADPRTQR